MASTNQPSTEGQRGHRATHRQKISGVVHLEADGLFEHRDIQAHNNHIGLIVVQAVHLGDICVLSLTALQAWIEVQFVHPFAACSQSLWSYLRRATGPTKRLACDER